MTPPARIKIGHLTYTVALVDGAAMGDVDADVDHDALAIRIGAHMARGQQAEKLVHECLHAIYDAFKVGPRWGEERTVSALAPALCSLLADNPALVTWLQAALGDQ